MEKITEYDIVQNVGIGALALHKFVCSYVATKEGLEGPTLIITFPVLPILFNKKTLEHIYSRFFEGGFYNALTEFRDISAGLQQRIIDMEELTCKSLDLGFKSKLLTYEKISDQIFYNVKKVKIKYQTPEIKKIIFGADRLGYWFASISFQQICVLLNINIRSI
jgi:hypothetical protein